VKLNDTPVAVTGATGFLGRYISLALLERRAKVVGVVRDPSRRPELVRSGVELRTADLAHRGALARAFDGMQAIVANAGVIPQRGRRLVDINVIGTENVLNAAHDAGVRRMILVSSVAVYRFNTRTVPESGELVSGRPGWTAMGAYRASKLRAEQIASRLAPDLSVDLTIVRPGQLYGAFDSTIPMIRPFLRIGLVPLGLRIPLAYGGDVAEAIVTCLETDETIGDIYTLAGPDRSAREFADAWRAAGGRIARFTIPIPIPIRFSYDTTRAVARLGWRHRPFLDALKETFAIEAAAQLETEHRGGHH
jgi:nucleoside-diphosphate-sugar epimerase